MSGAALGLDEQTYRLPGATRPFGDVGDRYEVLVKADRDGLWQHGVDEIDQAQGCGVIVIGGKRCSDFDNAVDR